MRAAVWITLFGIAACDRSRPADDLPPQRSALLRGPAQPDLANPPATTPAPGAKGSCQLPEIPLRYPAPKRLVAIGDLHGDLGGARSALRTAGAIDAEDRWIGGDLVVVQTGDILDRGDDEQAILDLLYKLESEAKSAGGALINLLGNHELMNSAGDFRYVTKGAMSDFDDVAGLDTTPWATVPEVARKRIAALAPGGPYAKKFAQHNIVAIVGDIVFSHAGVIGEWAPKLDEVNHSSRCWLDGQAGGIEAAPPALTSEDSPVWTRAYGGPEVDCAALATVLTTLGAKRMVVGHTVQEHISSACDGAAWRIDVGLSKNYGGPIEVLELYPSPRVLTGTR